MSSWLENYRTELEWSDYQNEVFDNLEVGKNLLIEARAGSGKTTLLEGIVAELLNQNPRYSILLLAFNKHIAEELKSRQRIPRNCEIRTSHSLGYKLLREYLPLVGKPDNLKIAKLGNEAIEKMKRAESNVPRLVWEGNYVARQKKGEFLRNLKRLVDLARSNFVQKDGELDALREKIQF